MKKDSLGWEPLVSLVKVSTIKLSHPNTFYLIGPPYRHFYVTCVCWGPLTFPPICSKTPCCERKLGTTHLLFLRLWVLHFFLPKKADTFNFCCGFTVFFGGKFEFSWRSLHKWDFFWNCKVSASFQININKVFCKLVEMWEEPCLHMIHRCVCNKGSKHAIHLADLP